MKVCRVHRWGLPLKFEICATPSPPTTTSQIQLHIEAVGIHRLVRGRAAGTHPSMRGATLPSDPSVDGVGFHEPSGELYYINALAAPLLAERANVECRDLVLLGPRGAVDPVAVAALVNPVSSSWMALRHRVSARVAGQVVLILGVTSSSGRAAIQVARHLGAARVLGCSRTPVEEDGLDQHIALLKDQPLDLSKGVGVVHIVLDYIGGHVASEALSTVTISTESDLDYIHIGDLGGEDDIRLPGQLLNKKPIRVVGSGMGSWNAQDLRREMKDMVAFTARLKRPDNIATCTLDDLESVWDKHVSGVRIVVTPREPS